MTRYFLCALIVLISLNAYSQRSVTQASPQVGAALVSALSQKCVDLQNAAYKANAALVASPNDAAILKAAQDASQAQADCQAQFCLTTQCYGYPPPTGKPATPTNVKATPK